MPTSRTGAFIAGAAGALTALVAAAVITPLYTDYAARARASEALVHLQAVQERIVERAVANQSLSGSGVGISPGTGPQLKEITVLPDGIVIAVASRAGQVFVLVPSYASGSVSWRCIAGSSKDVPSHCRS